MDLTEHYKTIATKMVSNFNQRTFFFIRDVSINDIVVDIHFTYHRYETIFTENIQIELFNDNILNSDEENISLLHFEISQNLGKHSLEIFCKLSLENLLEYLKNTTFDVLIGRFIPLNTVECPANHLRTSELQIATRAIFNSINLKIKDNSEECVVCYERTFCKTVCGHYLCFGCTAQIKPVSNTDSDTDEDDKIFCPICRSIILYQSTGGCGCR
jgi:DNA-directed RNA polymerase subunit RPC12/RpoP